MLPRINKDWPYEDFDYESTVSSDVIGILTEKLGHRTKSANTMGSTQSIHIKDGFNHGYADLRRPNAGVAIQAH
jgi:gamma-glutamyltranspeptidase/glutathione hydrolase